MSTKTHNEKFLVLIDGSSYLHRAFHALPSLTNSSGEPTGAIYGVVNMVKKLLADFDPPLIAVVFDAKGRTFRHDLYSAYKANRPPMSPELSSQIKPLYEVIEAMGIPLLVVEGVEADDVIATLAVEAQDSDVKVLISTGDKDMAQLVNDKVELIDTMTNVRLDEQGVKNKFGVTPKQIVDYLALIGDASDNVPGVAKVGPKTAAKLLHEYGSLDEIIKHVDEIKGVVGENIKNSIKQLPLSKKLVTLDEKVKLQQKLQELKKAAPEREKLIALLKRLEFKKWLAEMVQQLPLEDAASEVDYRAILTEADFSRLLHDLAKADSFAFDTETTSLDPLLAELVGISFSLQTKKAVYIPLAHDYEDAPKQLKRKDVLERLKPIFEDVQKIKLGQNLKYDIQVLANYAIDVRGVGYDTMLESYVLNSSAGRHALDILALRFLEKSVTTYADVTKSGKTQLTFNQVPLEKAVFYAAEDADMVLQLHEKIWPLLAEHKKLVEVFQNIEMPLVKVLAKIERTGVCIDSKLLTEQGVELMRRIKTLESKAYALAGEEFNLGSPKQLQEILFVKLKLPVLKKTPKKQPSTAEEVLQELALDYPLPKIILEYRSLAKLKSTYVDALPQQINSKTGRVHTSYNQAVTATGRLSSTDPNLQNIPVRTEEGRRIRKAFIAPAQKKIIAADYSQVELRIMAHLSKDAGLLRAFAQDEDIHRATAAEILNIPQEQVTSEQRRSAKAINFGLIYGMSAFGLSQQLNIPRELAQEYIDLYFARYPGVLHFMQETREKARQHGYVETMFGRRLYVPEINAANYQRQSAAERAAINAPMQGTAADIIKLAMIKIDQWIQANPVDMLMIMQVHDELVFEVATKDVVKAEAVVQEVMTGVVDLSVPLAVHIGVGDNWDEAHS